jgi:hypothetical protein
MYRSPSQGVTNANSLDGSLDDKIQTALTDQFVSRAYWLIGKWDGKPFPLSTIFLTFEVPSLPSYMYVGYERVSVQPYIPNPMQCLWCQKFGLTQQQCASNLVCGVCGEPGLGESLCPCPPHCVNCSGAHVFGDRRHPVFLDEKAIQELQVKDSLSFLDAWKKFFENKPKTGTQSYASALRRPRGIDATMQTTALLNRDNTTTLPQTTGSSQSEVCTQTKDLPTPTIPEDMCVSTTCTWCQTTPEYSSKVPSQKAMLVPVSFKNRKSSVARSSYPAAGVPLRCMWLTDRSHRHTEI